MGGVRGAEPGRHARDHRDPVRPGLGDRPIPLHLRVVHDPVRLPCVAGAGHPARDPLCHHHDGRGHGLRHLPQLGGAAGDHRGAAHVADVRGDGLPRASPPAGPGRGRGARRRARARRRAQVGVPVRRVARAPHPDHDRPWPHRAHAPQRSPRAGRAGRDVPGRPGRARTHGARDQAACSCWSRQAGRRPAHDESDRRRGPPGANLPALAGHGRPRLAAGRRFPRARSPSIRDQLTLALDALVENAVQHTEAGRADRDRRGRRVPGPADPRPRRRRRDSRGRAPARVRPLLPCGRRP